MQVGQTIDVAAPRGTFTLAPGVGPVALVSAGVGVTPVLAMLHALAADSSTRPVYWIHGARNRADDAFADEVARLLATLPGGRWSTCYSAPSLTEALDEPGVTSGRVTAAVVEQLGVPADADVYLCGPAAFMTDMTAAFDAIGFAPTHVHTETFGTLGAITPGVVNSREGPPRLPDGPPGTGPAVTFSRSGLTARWADRYRSVLELAEACRVPVRWSCRTGVCHTCETSLVSGDVAYEPEPVDRPALGTCSSVVPSPAATSSSTCRAAGDSAGRWASSATSSTARPPRASLAPDRTRVGAGEGGLPGSGRAAADGQRSSWMNGLTLVVHPKYSNHELEPFDTLILYWRLRPQPQPRENALVSSSELDELSAPTFDDELPSVAQVAGMPRALTLTWLCAQLTVTEVLSSLSTVMLTPQPADAGCVEAPTTPVAAQSRGDEEWS